MKICVAQTRPVKGDIQSNIINHKKLIDTAIVHETDLIVFPELSITGYEPSLASELATDKDDNRFDVFQKISNSKNIIIGVGMPIKTGSGVQIGMIIFQPGKAREVYAKQHLHSDELPYFVNGKEQFYLNNNSHKIALAICYELSVTGHSANAYNHSADVYLASVAKTAEGVGKAAKSLSDIAKKYSMTVLMSNCVGPCDNFQSAGKTAVWNKKGELVGQLNAESEGLLIFDSETFQLIEARV